MAIDRWRRFLRSHYRVKAQEMEVKSSDAPENGKVNRKVFHAKGKKRFRCSSKKVMKMLRAAKCFDC
eukprot:UN07100